MILKVFSVYDFAMKAYLAPFQCRSKGEALRNFSAVVNEKDHQFNKFAKDYSLMFLGEFDDNLGQFTNRASAPELQCTAVSCLVDDIEEPFREDNKVAKARVVM